MKLTPHQILVMMGFDIPEDGVQISPDDASLHQRMLDLLGTTISPMAISEEEFAKRFSLIGPDRLIGPDPERNSTRAMFNFILREIYHFKGARSSVEFARTIDNSNPKPAVGEQVKTNDI